MTKSLRFATVVILLLLGTRNGWGQILWRGTGGSAWLTGSNWTGGSVPGTSGYAQFQANPTAASVGINMNNPTNNGNNNEAVGGIELTGASAIALTIGNSTTAAGGTLTLNGTTIPTSGVANTILRNNSSQLFTIQQNVGTGTSSLSVALANATNNIINIDGTGGISISVPISGTGMALTKAGSGSGILNLSAVNTYTGLTTISTGTLQLGISNAIPSGGALTVSSGATLDLVHYNATLSSLSGAGTVSSSSGTSSLSIGDNTSTTFSGLLKKVSSGTMSVTKQGSGTLTLSGANTYTGATTISAGTLQVGATNSIPSTTAVTVTSTFDLNGFSDVIGSLAGAGTVDDVTGAGTPTLSAGTDGTSTSFAGVIQNTSGTVALTKQGVGIFTISGANTYKGATTISAGKITLGASNSIPSTSALTVSSGATFNMVHYDDAVGSIAGAGTIGSTSGTSNLTAGADNTTTVFSGVIQSPSSTLNFTKQGTGILTLSGTNTYTGTTTVSAGTLNVTGSTAAGSAVGVTTGATNSATLAGNGTVNGNVTLTGTSSSVLAIVSPGDATSAGSAGTLATSTTTSTGVLTFNNYSGYKCDINAISGTAGTNWDLVTAYSIAFATSSNIKIYVTGNPASFSSTTGYTWKIASATGANVTTLGNATFTFDVSGFSPTLAGAFTVVLAANNKDINLVYTPNPAIVLTNTNLAQIAADATPIPGTSKVILERFEADVTVANAILNSVAFNTAGTYVNTTPDISKLELYYSTTTTMPGSSLANTTTIPATGGTVTFGSLNTTINSGASGYFWITADIASGATATRTVGVKGTGSSGLVLSFTTGTPTGTINDPTLQTITAASTPNLAISGTPTNYGTICIGSPASSVQYTITNNGGVTASGVTVVSSDPQFVVSSLSSTTIAVSGAATYNVTFTPSGAGAQSATITVASTTTGSNSPQSSVSGTGLAKVTPAVSINSVSSVCSNQSVLFTPVPLNLGGGTAAYAWTLNGTANAASGSTYTQNAWTSGNSVLAVMTVSGGCVTSTTASSNSVAPTVTTAVAPSVSINTVSSVCSNQSVLFTPAPLNLGGGTAAYAWTINGAVNASTASTYTQSSWTSGNSVLVVMTVTGGCVTSTTANSNSVAPSVTTAVTPSVTINTVASVCSNQSVTFTPVPLNLGGGSASYEWTLNGTANAASGGTYTQSSWTSGNSVKAVLTVAGGCVTTTTANSNTVTPTVTTVVTPAVSINTVSSVCSNQSVTFSTSPSNLGGGTAAYAWTINGTANSASGTSYTQNAWTSGNSVQAVMTVTGGCVTSTTASSNTVTPTVTIAQTPSVTIAITTGSNPSCSGSSVVFTPTASNLGGGAVSAYHWSPSGTGSTFSSTSLSNGNTVVCSITVSGGCVTSTTAVSAGTTMTINSLPASASGLTNQSFCGSGGNVTFTVTDPGAGFTVEWSTNGTSNNDGSGAGGSGNISITKAVPVTEYARISNSNGCKSAAWVMATGTAITAPSISASPTNQSATTASAATFTVSASNAASYSWYESTNGGVTWGSSPLTTTGVYDVTTTPGSLIITNPTIGMNGYQYEVVVNGNSPCGTVTSSAASLTVTAAPIALVAWDFDGYSNYGASPQTPSTVAAHVTAVGLTRGSGVGTVNTAAANAWGGDTWGTGISTSAAAITNGSYVTFSVAANTGYTLTLTSISAYNVRRSSTGPTTGLWQYQIGSGAFTNIGSAITWGGTTSSSGNSEAAIDLTGISALQNLSPGTVVTFRIVNYNASGTGTWYLNDPGPSVGNDFLVNGFVNVNTTPSIAVSTPAVSGGSISQCSTNYVIYQPQLAITVGDATLNSAKFVTTGNYQSSDLASTPFKLYYTTSNVFATTTQLGSAQASTSTGAGETINFTGLSQTITAGSTGYLWLTVDAANTATAGRTLTVSASSLSDYTFTSGNLSGTPTGGTAQSFAAVSAVEVTGPSTSSCFLGGSTITWTNPTCYDQVLVVARATSAITSTPSGNGSGYTANAAFGTAGTDAGLVAGTEYAVYSGTGASVSVTGLTNGTTYNFKIFVRKGTTWSSGVTVSCAPASTAQLTPGNLLVYKVGPQSGGLTDDAIAITLNEYTVAGSGAVSISLPTTTGSNVNRITASGSATSEGQINLSANGNYITVTGYDAAVGTAGVKGNSSTTTPRVTGRLDMTGSTSLMTTIINDGFSKDNFRSAVTNLGTDFWLTGNSSGSTAGTRYITNSSTSSTATTSTQLSDGPDDTRSVRIVNGPFSSSATNGLFKQQLYFSDATTSGSYVQGVYQVGTGLPTSTGTTTTFCNGSTLNSSNTYPNSFIFLDRSAGGTGPNVMYVADDNGASASAGYIFKYYYDGSAWHSEGHTTCSLGGLYGLTGYVDGSGNAVLYATAVNGGSPGYLVKFTDNAAANATISSGNSFTTLVTTGSNTALRGLSFTPTKIATQPTNQAACVNSNASFTVVPAAGPNAQYSYQWFVSTNGGGTWTALTNGGIYGGAVLASGTSSTLTLTAVTSAYNNYQYQCVVTYMSQAFLVSSAVTLTVNPLPTVTITNPSAVCSPSTVDLTASAVTSGSTSGLTYTYWTNAGATSSYATPSAATAGTYYIKGTTGLSCSAIQPVVVTVNPTPTVTITNPSAVCSPSTVDLTASAVTSGSTAGLSYTYWTNAGATSSYSTPSAATAGTYYIKGTTGLSCSAVQPVVVTVNPTPTVTITNPSAVCSPSTVDLTASAVTSGSTAGLSYTYWTNAGATSSYATPSAATAGTYYIKGTTGLSCSAVQPVVVTVNALPVVSNISASPAIACINSPITLTATTSGGASPFTYSWASVTTGNGLVGGATTASATATPTALNTQTYTATVTDHNGCVGTVTGSVNVTVSAPPSSVTASNGGPFVVGQTISLSAAPTNLSSYQWSAPDGYSANGQTVNRSGATLGMTETYTVTATNSSGCTATASTDVLVATNATYIWNGNTSSDWTVQTNWTPTAPTGGPNHCAVDVIIPAVSNNHYPVISSLISVGNVEMDANAQLTLNGANMNVCKNWQGSNTSSAAVVGTGLVTLNGSSAQLISGYTKFQELMLDNSGGAQMQAGSAVDVYTALDLKTGTFDATNGTITFKSTSVTNVGIINNFSTNYGGTITGNIKAERYYDGSTTYNQHYMGSPVNTPALSQFGATGTPGYVIPQPTCNETALDMSSPYGTVFSFHESHGASCELSQWKVETTGNATNGVGYSVLKTGAGTLTLTGAPNLSDVTVTSLANTNGWTNQSAEGRPYSSGWQLLANPFLATIVIDPSVNRGSFDDQVWVWNTEGNNAGSYTRSYTVAPFQAFIVHKTSAGGNASYLIKASERVVTPQTFYQLNANEITITATNTANGLLDDISVGFNTNATDTFDAQIDANKPAGALGRHTIYSVNNGKWMGRNILHDLATTSTVPVGFEPGATGTYTLSFGGLNGFEPTSYIYLEDKALHIMYNVRNGDYTFTANSADNWDRFVLHFTPPAEISTVDAGCTASGTIDIQQPGTADWIYTLTDANNAIVTSGVLNQSQSVSVNVAAGAYTLTLTDTNNYVAVKSIVVNGPQMITAAFQMSADTVEALQSVILTASPTGATSYEWNLGNGLTATGANVTVNYAEPGVYTLSLLVTSQSGCGATQTQTITVVPANATGLNSITGTGKLNIWSNSNRVFVDFTALQKVNASITIYNILGQELCSDYYINSNIYQKEIDNIDAAYLIVRVKNDDEVITKKVFITNYK